MSKYTTATARGTTKNNKKSKNSKSIAGCIEIEIFSSDVANKSVRSVMQSKRKTSIVLSRFAREQNCDECALTTHRIKSKHHTKLTKHLLIFIYIYERVLMFYSLFCLWTTVRNSFTHQMIVLS